MSTEKAKVVLDTNIVISAAISKGGIPAKILKHLVRGDFINYTSKEILNEINGVFERDTIKRISDNRYFILSGLIARSILIEPQFDENVVYEDRSDDKFINCALTVKADIVSGDRHLLKLRKYKAINILSPREFLERLK